MTCWKTYGPYRKSIARWVMLSAVQSSNKLSLSSKGNDSNLLIVFYVQIMPDDFVMQLHRF
ncbi:hypothetical protein CR536_10145 [Escherichia coli]|nr:hypothetical protein CR536_10145 [Escherichia coli]